MYGPNDDCLKDEFLAEMAATAPPLSEPWVLSGDFNMIYEACDKNNPNINRRIIGKFRRALDSSFLREIKCSTRRFTWSNEWANPTLCSIDKFFCNCEWELMHPGFSLSAASTACSDHCPLILANAAALHRPARFRFEKFWPRFPRFMETVVCALERPVNHDCPFVVIKKKMQRVADDLKSGARGCLVGCECNSTSQMRSSSD